MFLFNSKRHLFPLFDISGTGVFFTLDRSRNMNFLIQSNIKNFKEYSQFKSLKDFNNNIEQWMVEYKHQFTPAELIALKRLIRYSAKIYGVANAMIRTILESVEELDFEYGVSRSTFKRMISKAKRIGLLEVKETVRHNMSQSSNLYIFQRFNTIEPPRTEGEPVEHATEQPEVVEQLNHLKANKIIKTNKQIINKRIDTLDYTYTADYVPKEFRNIVKCFFPDDHKIIEEYWRMVRIDVYHIKDAFNLDDDTILFTAIHSFKQMINKLKKGKVNNPIAYFKGIFNQKITNIYMPIMKD